MEVFLIQKELAEADSSKMLKASSTAGPTTCLMIGLITGFFEFERCLCLMEANVGRDAEGPAIVKAWKVKMGEGAVVAQRGKQHFSSTGIDVGLRG